MFFINLGMTLNYDTRPLAGLNRVVCQCLHY